MGDRKPELKDTHGTGYHRATRPSGWQLLFSYCQDSYMHQATEKRM